MNRRRNNRGSVPLEFALGVGVLILPIALLVLQIPRWLDRAGLASDLAHESARLCAQSDSIELGRQAAASFVGTTPQVLSVTCTTSTAELEPGGNVEAAVTVEVPAIIVPLLGIDTGNFTLTRRHTERVDQYRSFGP